MLPKSVLKKLEWFVGVIILAVFISFCTTRIDAGAVGVKINLYGNKKGVSEITEVTGRVWYNPFTQDVIEFPVYVQTKTFAEFDINTNDASEFTISPKLSYNVVRSKVAHVYEKYRQKLSVIEEEYIATAVYMAYRTTASKYTSDKLMEQREQFELEVRSFLYELLDEEGFKLHTLTAGIDPPKSLKDAIVDKNKAVQEALMTANKIKHAQSQAKIDSTEAAGAAIAMRIKADAEAYYNQKISSSLSPLIVQENFIEKWDGKLPQYGQVPTLFHDITK